MEQPFAAEDQSADDALRPPSLVSWSGRLYDQAALEEQLVGLAEPTAQFPPLQSTDAVTMRTLLAQYRWLGKALGQFYPQLPKEINQNFQARDPAVVRRCERWLRAVDARDAEQIRAGVAAIAVRGVQFPPPAAPASALGGQQDAGRPQDAQAEMSGAALPPRWGGRAAKFPDHRLDSGRRCGRINVVCGTVGAARSRRKIDAGWSSPVAREAHNLEVPGSNPGPATDLAPRSQRFWGLFI